MLVDRTPVFVTSSGHDDRCTGGAQTWVHGVVEQQLVLRTLTR